MAISRGLISTLFSDLVDRYTIPFQESSSVYVCAIVDSSLYSGFTSPSEVVPRGRLVYCPSSCRPATVSRLPMGHSVASLRWHVFAGHMLMMWYIHAVGLRI